MNKQDIKHHTKRTFFDWVVGKKTDIKTTFCLLLQKPDNVISLSKNKRANIYKLLIGYLFLIVKISDGV
jgi:hypothetical protein